jgi:hypothetical protein
VRVGNSQVLTRVLKSYHEVRVVGNEFVLCKTPP